MTAQLHFWLLVHLEDSLSGRSSKPPASKHWTHFPNRITETSAVLLLMGPNQPPTPTPPTILFKWELNFFFFQHVYVIICKSYQKWTMRHKRGTHTQFNEVFTDNSNCQILVPDDIVQSADAQNCLSLSCSLPPRYSRRIWFQVRTYRGEKRLRGLPVGTTAFTKRKTILCAGYQSSEGPGAEKLLWGHCSCCLW